LTSSKTRINKLVTVAHIVLIGLYTLFNFLADNFAGVMKTDTFYRVNTCYYFTSGLIDIFVAYMMWFVLDEENNTQPIFIRDENSNSTYLVLDIIRTSV